jgi:thymidylate synthase
MEKKNNLDPQYNNLLKDILENGVKKQTRNGEVLSLFGRQIRHNMSDGFPLLTGKKMFFKGIVTELMWFLMGDTNIKYLVDNDCHIWDGDCYKNYLSKRDKTRNADNYKENINGGKVIRPYTQEEFINKIKTDDKFRHWGELGPIYGKQWRNWNHPTNEFEGYDGIDQIQNLINNLKTNPDSRRLMVNAWNVGELDQMVLPPCHYGFQVYTRELTWDERYVILKNRTNEDPLKYSRLNNGDYDSHPKEMTTKWMNEINIPTRAISLMWNQRSVDVFLGLPFNIASYGLLLEMIAREVNMVPEHLIGHLGDTHLYSNHIEQAKEQISREPKGLPTLKMSSGHNFRAALKGKADEIDLNDFILLGYEPHPTIKAPLSN